MSTLFSSEEVWLNLLPKTSLLSMDTRDISVDVPSSTKYMDSNPALIKNTVLHSVD